MHPEQVALMIFSTAAGCVLGVWAGLYIARDMAAKEFAKMGDNAVAMQKLLLDTVAPVKILAGEMLKVMDMLKKNLQA